MRADLKQQPLPPEGHWPPMPVFSSAKRHVMTLWGIEDVIYFFSEASEFSLNTRYLLQTHPNE